MNEELTLLYLKRVIGFFNFKKRLFAWEIFEPNLTKPVKKLLKKINIYDTVIPGGCTKCIGAPNVFWNKSFKDDTMEFNDEWLAFGVHHYTEVGNMKPASRHLIVTSVLEKLLKNRSKEDTKVLY